MTLLEPAENCSIRWSAFVPARTCWPCGPDDAAATACRLMQEAVAARFGVALRELRARSRGRAEVAFARQMAMYLAHVALGLSCTDVGRLFGRDRTTVAHACRLVEERRDDPEIDKIVSRLEALGRTLTRVPSIDAEVCR